MNNLLEISIPKMVSALNYCEIGIFVWLSGVLDHHFAEHDFPLPGVYGNLVLLRQAFPCRCL